MSNEQKNMTANDHKALGSLLDRIVAKREARRKNPLIQRRKNRQTGSIISVWRPGSQADRDEGYLVICEDYGTCIGVSTRKEALQAAANPLMWCPDSQDNAAVRQ